MTVFVTTLGAAFVLGMALTPGVRRLALRWGVVDHPDSQRKLHRRAVPLGGGVAVLSALLLSLVGLLLFSTTWHSALSNDPRFLWGLATSSIVLCGIGLFDDCYGLRGRQKLVGQVGAVAILMASGLVIQDVHVFHWKISLGLLSIPFTVFWLVGAINALNLLDGTDGLATSIGIILSLALACMALMTGHASDAWLATAMAGSLLGFLYYNFPPAKIFLGDAGSMVIGLVLGALAIRSSLKGPATVALAAPTAIWAIPILDVSMAILRRKLTGRSLYVPDLGHLHHCLQQRGFSNVRTVLAVVVLCLLTATGALLSVYHNNEFLAIGAVVMVTATLVATRQFGHAEFQLLCRRTKSVLLSLISFRHLSADSTEQSCTRFQGIREWETLWQTLIEFAQRFNLSAVELNVHSPAIREAYHASWARRKQPDPADLWYTDLPLTIDNRTVGRLRIAGLSPEGSVCIWMADLIAGLKPFETQLSALLEDADATDSVRPNWEQRRSDPVSVESISPSVR